MKIISVKLGTITIPVHKFVDYIKSSTLSNELSMEVISDDDVKFLSKVQNIRMMEPDDPRIKKLNRNYLFTHAMTKEQQGIMLDFFKRNHLTVEFLEPVSNWLYATMPESNLASGNGGEQ